MNQPSFRYGSGIMLSPELDISRISFKPSDVRIHAEGNIRLASTEVPIQRSDGLDNHSMTIEGSGAIRLETNTQLITKALIRVADGKAEQMTIASQGSPEYHSRHLKIAVGKGASLSLLLVEEFSRSTTSFERIAIEQDADSRVEISKICLGGDYSSTHIETSLEGHDATCQMTVIFGGTGKQKYEIYTAASHNAPGTQSSLLTKGVLNARSRALSRGLIRIGSQASNSQGYERQDTLLLSELSEADAIPNLEILNHDVKCTHSSTVGQIDAEKLFYLMSRGLSEREAKQKMIEGYFLTALEPLSHELKERMEASLMPRINTIFEG